MARIGLLTLKPSTIAEAGQNGSTQNLLANNLIQSAVKVCYPLLICTKDCRNLRITEIFNQLLPLLSKETAIGPLLVPVSTSDDVSLSSERYLRFSFGAPLSLKNLLSRHTTVQRSESASRFPTFAVRHIYNDCLILQPITISSLILFCLLSASRPLAGSELESLLEFFISRLTCLHRHIMYFDFNSLTRSIEAPQILASHSAFFYTNERFQLDPKHLPDSIETCVPILNAFGPASLLSLSILIVTEVKKESTVTNNLSVSLSGSHLAVIFKKLYSVFVDVISFPPCLCVDDVFQSAINFFICEGFLSIKTQPKRRKLVTFDTSDSDTDERLSHFLITPSGFELLPYFCRPLRFYVDTLYAVVTTAARLNQFNLDNLLNALPSSSELFKTTTKSFMTFLVEAPLLQKDDDIFVCGPGFPDFLDNVIEWSDVFLYLSSSLAA